MKKLTLLFIIAWLLSGCIFSSESQQVREVTENFWTAVQEHDKEKIKNLATADSVEYLRFLSNEKFSVQRFEIGEVKIEEKIAEVATALYSSNTNSDLSIAVRTVLVKMEDGTWRVNVKKTMGSMASAVMGAVAEELNTFMQEGLKGLDKSLSENLDSLGKSLQEGVRQLQKDLNAR